eukprot:3718183-Prymnesium_polylepis.2
MRKIRPARASAELSPGTPGAATPHTLPSVMASTRPRPAARIPSLTRLLCFARPSSAHHASPSQHMHANPPTLLEFVYGYRNV